MPLEALLTVLAGILAMSPRRHAHQPQSAAPSTISASGFRRQIAAAEASEDLQEFISRTFRGNDVEGTRVMRRVLSQRRAAGDLRPAVLEPAVHGHRRFLCRRHAGRSLH